MAILTRDGQTWETRNNSYGYFDVDGTPCNIVEMRGDFDTWHSPDTILLHADRLDDGWVRYWLSSSDKENRDSLARLVAALDTGG
jgi:hypothetical protein